MNLSPEQVVAILEAAGGTGALALFAWIMVKEILVTAKARDRDVKAAEAAAGRELKAVVAGKDAEIAELNRRLQESRDIINRNSGSQSVQANTVADAMTAMLQFMASIQARQVGAPPLSLPGTPGLPGPMP